MTQAARWFSVVAVASLGVFRAAPAAADQNQRARPAVAIGIGTGAPEMLHLDVSVPVVPAISIEARLWGYFLICYSGFGAEAGVTGYAALGHAWWFLATVTGGWGIDSHGGGGICAGGTYPAWLLRPAVGIAWRGEHAENRLQAGFIFRTDSQFLGGDLTKTFIPSLTYTHFF